MAMQRVGLSCYFIGPGPPDDSNGLRWLLILAIVDDDDDGEEEDGRDNGVECGVG